MRNELNDRMRPQGRREREQEDGRLKKGRKEGGREGADKAEVET